MIQNHSTDIENVLRVHCYLVRLSKCCACSDNENLLAKITLVPLLSILLPHPKKLLMCPQTRSILWFSLFKLNANVILALYLLWVFDIFFTAFPCQSRRFSHGFNFKCAQSVWAKFSGAMIKWMPQQSNFWIERIKLKRAFLVWILVLRWSVVPTMWYKIL